MVSVVSSPHPSADGFVPLSQALDQLGEHKGEEAKELIYLIKKSAPRLGEFLAAEGFRSFRPLGVGTSAMVLEGPNNQVIRVRCKDEYEVARPNIMETIQPITTYSFDRVEIEILPKLDIADKTTGAADYRTLSRHVSAKGYAMAGSLESGDYGFMSDGTLLGADQNAIDGNPKAVNITGDAKYLSPSTEESRFPELKDTGYISKQEALYPALRDGRPRGVLTNHDRERLEAGELEVLKQEKPECLSLITTENLEEFIKLVFTENLYPAQAHKAMGLTKDPTLPPFKEEGRGR